MGRVEGVCAPRFVSLRHELCLVYSTPRVICTSRYFVMGGIVCDEAKKKKAWRVELHLIDLDY